ncbi:MAG: hypothetical protein AAGJ52_10640 [Pseudomonadota bacterium]
MTDFNLIINENQDAELVATSEDSDFNSLLSDEVVMQWLMDLEAEDIATGLQDSAA